MASPICAQQTSAEESRQEFDTRMYNMVAQLESKGALPFFYKIVSKSMATEVVKGPFAYSLEFPIDFFMEHGRKFNLDVTFGLEDSQRTWPVKLTVRSVNQSNPRVFAYGEGGWKTFLMENHIKVGDILIFELISFSEFKVIIGRAPIEVHPDDDDSEEDDMDIEGENEDDNTSPWWNADQAPVSCGVCKQAPPCPRFVVTIRPSSSTQHLSLTVPGRFWELHGDMLECNDLQLKGPNKVIRKVKANRIYDAKEEKLTVRLDSGWRAFRVANKLRAGDVLEFFLVGNSCFTVDLLERIEKN